MKPGDEGRRRPLVDLDRSADLLDPAVVHHRDPVAHRQRLLLIVGDVDEGDPDLALDPLQLDLEPLAQLQVERPERLVEQQHLRQVDQRPRQRHPLLLPARELRRAPLRLGREADPLELGARPARRSRPSAPSCASARRRRCRRRSGAGRGRSSGRRCWSAGGAAAAPSTSAPSIRIVALARRLEAGDHPQRRRLAAAARPEQGEELARRASSRLRSSTATTSPKRLVTPASSTLGCCSSSSPPRSRYPRPGRGNHWSNLRRYRHTATATDVLTDSRAFVRCV